MKLKNHFILSLAALAATANITFAREVVAHLEPVEPISEMAVSTTSDLDGLSEPIRKSRAGGRLAQATVIHDGQTATVIADKDAPYEQVRKVVNVAQATATKIPAQNSGEGRTFNTRVAGVIKRSSSTGSRMLVVPKDADGAKNITEVEEDLNVMAHILGKAVSGDTDKSSRAMGIAVTSKAPPGSSAGPQNLFIEGYGALFFLNVNYPLVPPPARESEPEPKDKTSNEWEEARREISQPQRYSSGGFGGGSQGGDVFGGQNSFLSAAGPYASGDNAPEYNAARVDELKKDLIAALKNAAHIRKLKSDDTVTVVVTAPGTSSVTKSKVSNSRDTSEDLQLAIEPPMTGTFQYASWSSSHGPSTKLIFRARKSDAEAFQTGKLSFDEFRKKVSVILY